MAKTTDKEGSQFLRYFGPVLDALRSLGGSGTPAEVVERVARDLKVSEDVQNELMDSGAPRFSNQVAWARFYLTRESFLDKSKRGVWSLTDKGREAHLSASDARAIFSKWVRIDRQERLKRQQAAPEESEDAAPVTDEPEVPVHRQRLLKILQDLPPAGFERLCQRLLREADFIQVVVTGRSGDGGIDGYGTLQVNPLVSFRVLFQCKRYLKSVSPSQVRDFRGAMQGRTDKGIILTTGSFTAEARREGARDGVPPIELVDGDKLMEMFERLELGLKPVTTFEIDDRFFEDFANQSGTS